MTATLRKWAADLMVGAGIAVLGLVLLAGSGTALGVTTPTDGAAGTCKLNPDNSRKDLGAACKRDNGTPGTCQQGVICQCSQ